ncbi:MAG: DUF2007 domain-containing protein [Armatimonadetes bacterium]|jgi:hypothetical protein|nr:DUF2007 domain-containing protein [Armatimonadota bacterium]
MDQPDRLGGGTDPQLESVFEARDSVAAELARGVLESAGIPVLVQSFQVPWYDGVMTAGAGAWGRLLVPSHLADDARQILTAYFEGTAPDTEAPSPPESPA